LNSEPLSLCGVLVSSHFGILGDIHGNFTALDRILTRHPEIPFWLCVGDVANAAGEYPQPQAPLYWIKGNNEAFDRIDAFQAGSESVANLHYLPNGTAMRIGPILVVGVGGTFAPTWYDTRAMDLPHPRRSTVKATELADKRRHFVREEVEACKALGRVDVLLTHEAPTPFWIDLPSSTTPSKRWRRDVGKPQITELAEAVQPQLHCFGHHHTFASFTRAGIPTICVDRINRSYLVVDVATFAWESRPTEN
jgi:Icc-related predicted phosphoesterase